MTARFLRLIALSALASLPVAMHTASAQSGARAVVPSNVPPLTTAQQRALLLDPARVFWKSHAPVTVTADIETSRGTVTIELNREWAPAGVDRFYNLARAGYFNDSRFYRVLSGFVAQFGIAGNPAIATLWSRRHIPADSLRERNVRGTLAFAQFKPTDRTTNLFINLRDNPELDSLGFTPIGRVVHGMEIADSLYTGYGEFPAAAAPVGNPKRLYGESNRYLDQAYPKLDRIVKIIIR